MADQPQAGGAAEAGGFPPFVLNGQYIRDLSFEAPKAPGIFGALQGSQPDIKINVDVGVQALNEKLFEVALRTVVNCMVGDSPAFILELTYAGLFTVDVARDKLHATLLVDCPKLLFPFARHLIATLSREGGFPPVMVGLVDFEAMYLSDLKRRQAEAAAGTAAAKA